MLEDNFLTGRLVQDLIQLGGLVLDLGRQAQADYDAKAEPESLCYRSKLLGSNNARLCITIAMMTAADLGQFLPLLLWPIFRWIFDFVALADLARWHHYKRR